MDAIEKIIVDCLPIITATVGPLVVAAAKKYGPEIPKLLLPLLATGIGTVVGYVGGLDFTDSAALGAASVAVREILDQLKKAVANLADTDPTV